MLLIKYNNMADGICNAGYRNKTPNVMAILCPLVRPGLAVVCVSDIDLGVSSFSSFLSERLPSASIISLKAGTLGMSFFVSFFVGLPLRRGP